MLDNYRNSRDPKKDYRETSEFSWGPGPVPLGKEHGRAKAVRAGRNAHPLNSRPAATSACRRDKPDGGGATRRAVTPATGSTELSRSEM